MIYTCMVLFAAVNGWAQTGGGIYVRSGGKVVGTVVHGNLAEDGYGLAGGDAEVINSTVCTNGPMGNIMDGIQPGDISCADDTIRSRAGYEKGAEKDAIGVVFWVNSNYYAAYPRGYVVALEQSLQQWTAGIPRYANAPLSDTACYQKTQELAAAGNEAAMYCAGYAAGGEVAGRWCMPAGRQLSLLYTNQAIVSETLDFLSKPEEGAVTGSIAGLEETLYWSVSIRDAMYVWMQEFRAPEDMETIYSGSFIRLDPSADPAAYAVRPIFVY